MLNLLVLALTFCTYLSTYLPASRINTDSYFQGFLLKDEACAMFQCHCQAHFDRGSLIYPLCTGASQLATLDAMRP